MRLAWNAEQILAFAPDASSAKAGRGEADPRSWSHLGSNERSLWGACQGSAKLPYQVQVDLTEPAFKCTCPSRKFPCKHGIGLLLLFDGHPGKFTETTAPDWVAEWIGARDGRNEQKKQREEAAVLKGPPDEEAQAKRAAQREAKINAGLDELELWLRDVVRHGLAELGNKQYKFWDDRAARLVDAQAPGVARMVRELAGVTSSGPGWQDRLLGELARIRALIDAWRQIDRLPDEVRADVRTLIGFAQQQADRHGVAGVRDHWVVLGRVIEQEDRLRVQRTWLWGTHTQSDAVVFDFAVGNAALDASLQPGLGFDAELVYFPGGDPKRALVRDRTSALVPEKQLPACQPIAVEHKRFRKLLAKRPWLDRIAVRVADVVPLKDGERWLIRDPAGEELPLATADVQAWGLLAMSGGVPFSLAGEWNGESLRPLSVAVDGRILPLGVL